MEHGTLPSRNRNMEPRVRDQQINDETLLKIAVAHER